MESTSEQNEKTAEVDAVEAIAGEIVAEIPSSAVNTAEAATEAPPAAVPADPPRVVEVRSKATVPSKGHSQLYHRVGSATKLIGFEVEDWMRVTRVTAGVANLTASAERSWRDILSEGLAVGQGQYVTLHVENLSAEAQEMKGALVFEGGERGETAANVPFNRGGGASSTSSVSGASVTAPQAATRPAPESPVTLIMVPFLAKQLLSLLRDGRRPPSGDVPKIQGRFHAAVASVGLEVKKDATGQVYVTSTVGAIDALSSALRHGPAFVGAERDKLAAALHEAIHGTPKAVETAPSGVLTP